jgi:adenosylcobinamide kinase / adenosylcobinamide-phosphate guanylyltransferase
LDLAQTKKGNKETRLVIGGARSGKSKYAQNLAETSGRQLVLVATAQVQDREMAARIECHRAARSEDWCVIEEPQALVQILRDATRPDRIVVVDCLTLWLSNRLLAACDLAADCDALVRVIKGLEGPVVFVTNEVGAGIVPETELGRIFRDAQGRLNQSVAAACSHVVLIVAGLPLSLKSTE